MSLPRTVRCYCGENVFVLRVGICKKCGEVWASHRASQEEKDQAIKESEKMMSKN